MSVTSTNDPRIPIDRGWAWMCLLGSIYGQFTAGGLIKTTGVLLVDFVDIFHMPNSAVNWIPTCLLVSRYIAAAFGSGLGLRYGQRIVSMTGGVLLLLGLGLNYFATNFAFILVFYGIVTGTGVGLVYVSSMSMVVYYFQRRRAFANGVAVAGASMGQLIFPPIMRTLIDNYSIRGALLILGAICFNVFTFSALFRPLSFYMRGSSVPILDNKQQNDDLAVSDLNVSKVLEENIQQNVPHILIDKMRSNEGDQPEVRSLENIRAKVLPQEVRPRASTVGHYDKHLREKYFRLKHLTIDHRNSGGISRNELFLAASTTLFPSIQNLSTKSISEQDISSLQEDSKSCCPAMPFRCTKTNKITALYDFTLLRNPLFLMILFSFSFGQFAYLSQTIFLPAKAEEINIERPKAALLLSYAAAGEIVGRLVLGILTDLKVLRSHHLMAICSLANGAAAIWCPFATTYSGLVVFAVCLGVFGGAVFGMIAVLIADLLGVDKISHALGLVMLFTVFGTLLGPPFQGWLKDTTGTYDWSYYISGILCILVTIILLLEPFAQRYLRKYSKNYIE